jgi:hypothetical protein
MESNLLFPGHPPGPTTQVSELTVLTITSTHCCGVPTRKEIADQDPSYPYLLSQGKLSWQKVCDKTFTDQFIEGVTLNGAVTASERCTKRSVTASDTIIHLVGVAIVTRECAFFRRLVKESFKCCGKKVDAYSVLEKRKVTK